ncbi:MAG: hypothetical protein Fur0010_05140 [Bdellovibrio sp.]
MLVVKLFALLSVINSAFAEGGGHHAGHVTDLMFPFINFIVLFVGLWFWKLKKALNTLFENNAKEIEELYNSSEEKIKEATLKLDMYEKKMANLDQECAKILSDAEKDALAFQQQTQVQTEQKIKKLEEEYVARAEYERKNLIKEVVANFFNDVLEKTKSDIKKDKTTQNKASSKLLSQI